MKMTEGIMGMSVAVEVLDPATGSDLDEVLDYFHVVDALFSPYKKDSEISHINEKKLKLEDASPEVKKVLKLCEQTRILTNGYFDILIEGRIDPSGLVKGYAICEAAKKLKKKGYKNFYIEIGGDIEIVGLKNDQKWRVGIKNPFKPNENTDIVHITNAGIATSGLYERGMHIYNPLKKKLATEIKSMTVIAKDIYEADRFATASFAMGIEGMNFLEKQENLEAFCITDTGEEIETSGFSKYRLS
jgi:thiamine biosynthesis lipoprotein